MPYPPATRIPIATATHSMATKGSDSDRQKRLYETIIAATPDLVYVIGLDYRFTFANDALLRMWGRSLDDSIGRGLRELACEEWHAAMHEREIDQIVATKEPIRGEVSFPHAELGRRIYDYIFVPVFDERGEVEAIAGTTRDITLRREAQRQVEEARAQAEAANRAKSDFLAAMSHELRTPLNAIAGYVQLLRLGVYGQVPAEQQGVLERVEKSQQHLLSLINDVLNFIRLEAGRVEYRIADVPLGPLVDDVCMMVEQQLQVRCLSYQMGASPYLVVRADREKSQQILLNLLTNAAKFTNPGGSVALDAFLVPRTEPPTVAIRVRDTGIGIPADRLEEIFDPFVQVHRNLTRTIDGTGLGLAISRDLARGMGGDLVVKSVEGEGSTFTLTLPASPASD
ncbi:MAG TPA: PAS domain-containing sensor histidine kinase [Gemmatimonadaceae bacterium]